MNYKREHISLTWVRVVSKEAEKLTKDEMEEGANGWATRVISSQSLVEAIVRISVFKPTQMETLPLWGGNITMFIFLRFTLAMAHRMDWKGAKSPF